MLRRIGNRILGKTANAVLKERRVQKINDMLRDCERISKQGDFSEWKATGKMGDVIARNDAFPSGQ